MRMGLAGKLVRLWIAGATLVAAPLLGMILAKRDSVAHAADAEAKTIDLPPKGATARGSDLVGVLLTPNMATVTSPAEARVLAIAKNNGTRVRKGDVLVVLEGRALEHELEAARASEAAANGAVHAAQADVNGLEKKVARLRSARDFVSGESMDDAIAALGAARGRLATAVGQAAAQKAQVARARDLLADASVKAPFDGVVTGIYANVGTTATRGQPLVRLVGGEGLRARIAVPEGSGVTWEGHSRARLALDDGRILWAYVEQVPHEVDPVARAWFVEGRVVVTPESCPSGCELLAGRAVHATLIPDVENAR